MKNIDKSKKKYGYIFAKEREKNKIPDDKLHDKLDHILILDIELTTLSPLYIGKGPFEITQIDNKCALKLVHTNNRPYIPGSSLKGCIRTYFEYHEPHSCIINIKNRKNRENCRLRPDERDISLCKTCSLFGASGFSSRISITDAFPLNKNLKLTINYRKSPRPKDRENNERKRKYYLDVPINNTNISNKEIIQVFPINTKFSFKIRIQNPSDDELKTLFTAMNLCPEKFIPSLGSIKLGGMKDQGFGKIKFDIIKIRSGSSLDFILDKEKIISDSNSIKNFITNICK
ncbi:MAG: RAMP superfamily CRISPR-associated protein [Candidatus Helarchaeota archaeon]